MSPLKLTTLRLDDQKMAALQRIKVRDGIPVSEQVRRAIDQWIATHGDPAAKKAQKRK